MNPQIKLLSQLVLVPTGGGCVLGLSDRQLDKAQQIIDKEPHLSLESLVIRVIRDEEQSPDRI